MGRRKFKLGKQKNKNKIPAAEGSAEPESSEAAASATPPWIELPGDVTANILQRLGAEEILESAQKVCTTWRRICQDPAMWRVVVLRNPGDLYEKFDKMCRIAVDRSQGQLIDLTMDYLGDDKLLKYIAERSSHLRRLTFDTCYYISGECLAEAVKKLPHLEELHILISPTLQAGDVENIGISCPMLKSFTFNERGSKHPLPRLSDRDEFMAGFEYNEIALAIAKTMPNLRQLRLFAHWMKNEGLEAILDGCPHLESLDLRQCSDLDLEPGGALRKRCSQQIKDMRWPSDSISDIWWLAAESSEDGGQSYDSGFSDLHSFGYFDDDYEYYEDYEYYDDYTSPLGIGFFGDVAWFLDDDDI